MRVLTLALLAGALIGCLGERTDLAADATGADDTTPVDTSDTSDTGDTAGTDTGDTSDTGDDTSDPPPLPLLELGDDCVASAECASGRCALPCVGYGQCAPATCEADAECAGGGTGRTHCCVGGTCVAVEGDACGDRAGGQGAPCGDGGPSDCKEGLQCLDGCQPTSYCAAECEDDAGCDALGPDLACYTVVGGGQRCVVDPEAAVLCETAADCKAGAECVPILSYDGTYVIKSCRDAFGPGAMGTACSQAQDCRSAYCVAGYCSGGCAADDDCECTGGSCAPSHACLDTWFQLDAGMSAARLCQPWARCESTADCGDETCAAWAEGSGWSTVCVPPPANADDAGAPCATSDDCAAQACYEGVCRDVCAQTSQCADATCTPAAPQAANAPDADLGLCL